MIRVATWQGAHILFDGAAWTCGLALGWALSRWRLREVVERVATTTGPGYFLALLGGAIPGAWFTGSLNTLLGPQPTLSHSVAGALVGGIVGVEIYKRLRGVEGSTGGVFVGPFALGVVIGRWGCLFTGLPDRTYGLPTSLPWAVDLGDGVGRHPVQVYESLAMAVFLGVYLTALAARRPWALRRGFYALAIAYGAQRFCWEFLKPYPRLLGPFNVFHLLAVGLIVYGLAYWRRDLRRTDPASAG